MTDQAGAASIIPLAPVAAADLLAADVEAWVNDLTAAVGNAYQLQVNDAAHRESSTKISNAIRQSVGVLITEQSRMRQELADLRVEMQTHRALVAGELASLRELRAAPAPAAVVVEVSAESGRKPATQMNRSASGSGSSSLGLSVFSVDAIVNILSPLPPSPPPVSRGKSKTKRKIIIDPDISDSDDDDAPPVGDLPRLQVDPEVGRVINSQAEVGAAMAANPILAEKFPAVFVLANFLLRQYLRVNGWKNNLEARGGEVFKQWKAAKEQGAPYAELETQLGRRLKDKNEEAGPGFYTFFDMFLRYATAFETDEMAKVRDRQIIRNVGAWIADHVFLFAKLLSRPGDGGESKRQKISDEPDVPPPAVHHIVLQGDSDDDDEEPADVAPVPGNDDSSSEEGEDEQQRQLRVAAELNLAAIRKRTGEPDEEPAIESTNNNNDNRGAAAARIAAQRVDLADDFFFAESIGKKINGESEVAQARAANPALAGKYLKTDEFVIANFLLRQTLRLGSWFNFVQVGGAVFERWAHALQSGTMTAKLQKSLKDRINNRLEIERVYLGINNLLEHASAYEENAVRAYINREAKSGGARNGLKQIGDWVSSNLQLFVSMRIE